MLIHDDIYSWRGFGGRLKLGSGSCRLRIHDLKKDGREGVAYLKPIIVIVTDIPESRMSIRSCAGHIATSVIRDFDIDPQRMLYVEYYPSKVYGLGGKRLIPERFEAVEFIWHDRKGISPKWRELKPPMSDIVKDLL